VPERLTVCGLLEALSLTSREALSAPEMLGLNVILMLHVAPEAIVAVQLLVSLKSAALGPVMVAPVKPKFTPPLLVRVID
jgi:hypothetical protein